MSFFSLTRRMCVNIPTKNILMMFVCCALLSGVPLLNAAAGGQAGPGPAAGTAAGTGRGSPSPVKKSRKRGLRSELDAFRKAHATVLAKLQNDIMADHIEINQRMGSLSTQITHGEAGLKKVAGEVRELRDHLLARQAQQANFPTELAYLIEYNHVVRAAVLRVIGDQIFMPRSPMPHPHSPCAPVGVRPGIPVSAGLRTVASDRTAFSPYAVAGAGRGSMAGGAAASAAAAKDD
jgi:hypothetical protein